jgi:hypothetical protein
VLRSNANGCLLAVFFSLAFQPTFVACTRTSQSDGHKSNSLYDKRVFFVIFGRRKERNGLKGGDEE